MTSAATPSVAVLLAAIAVDRLLGEPPARLHPVVWMGACVTAFERVAPRAGAARQFLAGSAIAWGLPLALAALTIALLDALARWPWAVFLVAAYLTKSCFALRALGAAGREVETALTNDDLSAARARLRALCSRDATPLGASEIAAGAIESLAENLSDSFVAPLFWYALLGAPGIVAYRAVNTLDARIGYHGRHEYLGKVAARTDDVANLLPARLTALAILAAGMLGGADTRRAWRTWRDDRRKTESPNAGGPMAAIAGVLRVELTKPGHYRLGEGGRPPDAASLGAAWSVVRRAAVLAAVVVGSVAMARRSWSFPG